MCSDGFDAWWALYPNKIGKDAARAAYRKALGKVSAAVLYEALVVQRGALGQNKAQGFTLHPTTWLNQGRWQDDPDDVAIRRPEQRGNVQLRRIMDQQRSASLSGAGSLNAYYERLELEQ